jgi:hypothetical protein
LAYAAVVGAVRGERRDGERALGERRPGLAVERPLDTVAAEIEPEPSAELELERDRLDGGTQIDGQAIGAVLLADRAAPDALQIAVEHVRPDGPGLARDPPLLPRQPRAVVGRGRRGREPDEHLRAGRDDRQAERMAAGEDVRELLAADRVVHDDGAAARLVEERERLRRGKGIQEAQVREHR